MTLSALLVLEESIRHPNLLALVTRSQQNEFGHGTGIFPREEVLISEPLVMPHFAERELSTEFLHIGRTRAMKARNKTISLRLTILTSSILLIVRNIIFTDTTTGPPFPIKSGLFDW